jgi:4-carboxymuconolactone decarboxylase
VPDAIHHPNNPEGESRFDVGARVRTQVLGAEHVARNGGTDREAATPLQQLMTEVGWGTFWTRGTLELRERSIVTVSMLIALNRPHELRTHLMGALNNGVTVDQARELIIHAVPYCGFPAAIDAMRVLDELLADQDRAR